MSTYVYKIVKVTFTITSGYHGENVFSNYFEYMGQELKKQNLVFLYTKSKEAATHQPGHLTDCLIAGEEIYDKKTTNNSMRWNLFVACTRGFPFLILVERTYKENIEYLFYCAEFSVSLWITCLGYPLVCIWGKVA